MIGFLFRISFISFQQASQIMYSNIHSQS